MWGLASLVEDFDVTPETIRDLKQLKKEERERGWKKSEKIWERNENVMEEMEEDLTQ